MRFIALLTVLALTSPSVGALVCDVACGAQHQSAAASSSPSCHDHAMPQSDWPTVSAMHVCHEMGSVPASIVRDAAMQLAVAPAILRSLSEMSDPGVSRELSSTHARLTGHAPPPLALPLRI